APSRKGGDTAHLLQQLFAAKPRCATITATNAHAHQSCILTAMKYAMLSAAAILALGAFYAARPQAADDPLDSLKVCADTQKLIFENQFVRVIDDSIPPGVTEPRHRHRHGVSVYLSDYSTESISDDGKRTPQPRKSGTAQWSEAVIHQVKNTGTTISHAIRIELKY